MTVASPRSHEPPDSFAKGLHKPIPGLKGQDTVAQGVALLFANIFFNPEGG